MRYAIIVGASDTAGQNIKKELQHIGFNEINERYDGHQILQCKDTKVYTINSEPIYFYGCDEIDADILMFATKHVSKKGVPSLCTHAIGNWGSAEMGGRDNVLGIAPARRLKRAVQALEEKNTLGWEVFQEATHHGPASSKPVLFIEIGSSPDEYNNAAAGNIIAETIHLLLAYEAPTMKTAVGIGGLHHTANFKKIQIKSDIAIGHVCPKYNLQHLTKEMLLQAMDKTVPKAGVIILDWKGLGAEKERIKLLVENIATERKIEIMRTRDF